MGRKNVVKSFKMFDSTSISASAVSSVVNVMNLDKASIHVKWTGTSPVGEIKVEARNGEKADWREISMGGTISVSGNSGEHDLVFNELPFTDIRLSYVSTSGTGSIDATITSKVVGA